MSYIIFSPWADFGSYYFCMWTTFMEDSFMNRWSCTNAVGEYYQWWAVMWANRHETEKKKKNAIYSFHHRRRRVNKLQKQAATGKAPPCWTEEHGGGVNEFLFIWKQCEDINDGVFTCKHCFTIGSIGLVTEVRNVWLKANLRWHVSMFADATCHPSTWCWLPFDVDSDLYRVFRII